MNEVWKEIKDYPGYEISNLWRVRKLTILSLTPTKRWYLRVGLYSEWEQKKKRVHRLVAEAFLLNDKDCKEVNHIDEDKGNNRIENLEWCDRVQNMRHSRAAHLKWIKGRVVSKSHGGWRKRHVVKISKEGKHIEEYESLDAAANANGYWSTSNISGCCRWKVKQAYGYIRKYAES